MRAKFKPSAASSPPPKRMREGAPNPAKADGDYSERRTYVARITEQRLREKAECTHSAYLALDRKLRRGEASEKEVARAHGAYIMAKGNWDRYVAKGADKAKTTKTVKAESESARDTRHAARAVECKEAFERFSAELQSHPRGSVERLALAESARQARSEWLALTGGVERREMEVAASANSWDERK